MRKSLMIAALVCAVSNFGGAIAQTAKPLEMIGIPVEKGFEIDTLKEKILGCDDKISNNCRLSGVMSWEKATSLSDLNYEYSDDPEKRELYNKLKIYFYPEKYVSRYKALGLEYHHRKLPEVKALTDIRSFAEKKFHWFYSCHLSSCPSYFTDQSQNLYSVELRILPDTSPRKTMYVSMNFRVPANKTLTKKQIYNALRKKYPHNKVFKKNEFNAEYKEELTPVGVFSPDGQSVLYVSSFFNNRSDYTEYTLEYTHINSVVRQYRLEAVKNRLAKVKAKFEPALLAVEKLFQVANNSSADVDL